MASPAAAGSSQDATTLELGTGTRRWNGVSLLIVVEVIERVRRVGDVAAGSASFIIPLLQWRLQAP
jgi:hypothetical protein